INSVGTSSPSNTASATTSASTGDTTPPVITVKGSNPMTIARGSIYIDPGATASDPDNGDMTSSIVTQNNVNSAVTGTYTVTYNVKDPAGNAAQQKTRTVNVITTPVAPMNDTQNTYGYSLYSARQVQAEFVSSSSSLVGKSIDTIMMKLAKFGMPSGQMQVGVFNADLTVKQLFGTKDASSVTPDQYTQYTFSLPTSQSYLVQSGDIIGIKFTGGDASNEINIMTDQSNTFDGTNSYLIYYTNSWDSFTDQDITMVLERNLPTDPPQVTPPMNILSVTTNSSRNIPNLGTPTVTDRNDPSPVISNNSTVSFPVGTTNVLWRATDSLGNIGAAYQKVTVISALPPASQYNRVVMINFDDNFQSIYDFGKPVLDKYNIKPTMYIICGLVGTPDYMNWSEVLSFQADGMDLQAHTMNHLHGNHLSQSQMDYEYGQTPSCMINNGAKPVHMMALPFYEGYNNATVINTVAKYYDMDRAGPGNTFFLHCDVPGSGQTDCRTFDSSGALTVYNRYNIRTYSSNSVELQYGYNETTVFSLFIKEVNSATTNTGPNSTEIPIVIYHRVALDNSKLDVDHKGITTMLLDAEMKYLVDNNFKFWTTKNLAYDSVKNWFYFKTS
ncbi:MAG: DUF5011 domain-containing protein, partial [Thaumarchaeota archaeon]